MGKAAKREKANRRRYFIRLTQNRPERFEMEWEKRLSSWLVYIEKNAGRFSDDDGNRISSIFGVVEEAMGILEACGQDKFSQYAKQTFDLLSTECCRAFRWFRSCSDSQNGANSHDKEYPSALIVLVSRCGRHKPGKGR
jgi:hypothetical protein